MDTKSISVQNRCLNSIKVSSFKWWRSLTPGWNSELQLRPGLKSESQFEARLEEWVTVWHWAETVSHSLGPGWNSESQFEIRLKPWVTVWEQAETVSHSLGPDWNSESQFGTRLKQWVTVWDQAETVSHSLRPCWNHESRFGTRLKLWVTVRHWVETVSHCLSRSQLETSIQHGQESLRHLITNIGQILHLKIFKCYVILFSFIMPSLGKNSKRKVVYTVKLF